LTVPFAANFDNGCGRPSLSRKALGSRDACIKSSRLSNGRRVIDLPTLAIRIITTGNHITLSAGTLSVIDRW
jgi:hypothetical protein